MQFRQKAMASTGAAVAEISGAEKATPETASASRTKSIRGTVERSGWAAAGAGGAAAVVVGDVCTVLLGEGEGGPGRAGADKGARTHDPGKGRPYATGLI